MAPGQWEQQMHYQEYNPADEAEQRAARAAAAQEAMEVARAEVGGEAPQSFDEISQVLTAKSWAELKNMKSPPELVVKVMSAINILFGVKAGWAETLKVLKDPNSYNSIKYFDVGCIKPKQFKALTKIVKDPQCNFETVKRKSNAAGGVVLFIKLVYVYAYAMNATCR